MTNLDIIGKKNMLIADEETLYMCDSKSSTLIKNKYFFFIFIAVLLILIAGCSANKSDIIVLVNEAVTISKNDKFESINKFTKAMDTISKISNSLDGKRTKLDCIIIVIEGLKKSVLTQAAKYDLLKKSFNIFDTIDMANESKKIMVWHEIVEGGSRIGNEIHPIRLKINTYKKIIDSIINLNINSDVKLEFYQNEIKKFINNIKKTNHIDENSAGQYKSECINKITDVFFELECSMDIKNKIFDSLLQDINTIKEISNYNSTLSNLLDAYFLPSYIDYVDESKLENNLSAIPFIRGKLLPIIKKSGYIHPNIYEHSNYPSGKADGEFNYSVQGNIYKMIPEVIRPKRIHEVGSIIIFKTEASHTTNYAPLAAIYSGGVPSGYVKKIKIIIIDIKTRKIIYKKTFSGSEPPKSTTYTGAVYGSNPIDEVVDYILKLPRKEF